MENIRKKFTPFDFDTEKFDSIYVSQINGDSMKGAGISNRDWLIIDKEKTICSGCIAVFELNGQRTVKRYEEHEDFILLKSENPEFKNISIAKNEPLKSFGVVLYAIKELET